MPLDTIATASISGNTLSVTANSASKINANSVNFSNTSSVRVNVDQGPTGVANVSFSTSLPFGIIIALSGD
jgi:hypothetical protein